MAENRSLKPHYFLNEGWSLIQRGLLKREECAQLLFLSPSPMGKREGKELENGHNCHLSSSLTAYHEAKDMRVSTHPNQALLCSMCQTRYGDLRGSSIFVISHLQISFNSSAVYSSHGGQSGFCNHDQITSHLCSKHSSGFQWHGEKSESFSEAHKSQHFLALAHYTLTT